MTTINTLATAQKIADNMNYFLQVFGYDTIGNVATLEDDLIKGVNGKPKNRIYSENDMKGILNIGFEDNEFNKTQEDSILMVSHPNNEKFKLVLVADGIGGEGSGDTASHLATTMSKEWFNKLPKEFFNYNKIRKQYSDGKVEIVTLKETLKDHLVDINNEIVRQLGTSGGTTFSAAITRNINGIDTVMSVSIGDSKILKISQNGEVVQLSKSDDMLTEGIESGSIYVEDSDTNNVYTSEQKYETLYIKYKPRENMQGTHTLNEGDMRFHRKNNIITGYLGSGQTRRTIEEETR